MNDKNDNTTIDNDLRRMTDIIAGLLLADTPNDTPGYAAAMAFWVLHYQLSRRQQQQQQHHHRPLPLSPIDLQVVSEIPVGAGLGSSASYSVCLAAGLLWHHRMLSTNNNTITATTSTDTATTSDDIPFDDTAIAAGPIQDQRDLLLINRWSFLAEKVIHGDPSGIDNCVATYGIHGGRWRMVVTHRLSVPLCLSVCLSLCRSVYVSIRVRLYVCMRGCVDAWMCVFHRAGGAIAYRKGVGMDPIAGFSSLSFLLTNTRVPRDTKNQVANVRRLRDEVRPWECGVRSHSFPTLYRVCISCGTSVCLFVCLSGCV